VKGEYSAMALAWVSSIRNAPKGSLRAIATGVAIWTLLIGLGAANAGEVLDKIKSSGVLHAPYPDNWPPNAIVKPNGEVEGYDIDVFYEIAHRMGVKAEFVKNPDGSVIAWEEQTSGKWGGKYDIVVGGMAPTAKRAEHLKFPAIYRYVLGVLAVNKDSTTIHTPADASGKRIGVLKSSLYEKYLQRDDLGNDTVIFKIEDPVIVEFDHEEQVWDAIAKNDGSVDATINSLQVIMELIKEGKPIKVIGQPLYYGGSAIAVQPGDEEFATQVQAIVESMKADGTLAAMALKWYDFDLSKPP
jgi:polar amino acid transport system substrate-binding protein